MTKALSILCGRFGRVALLDMDTSLVGHAHPHYHLILTVAGPDQEFVVDGQVVPLRRDTVVAVNAWQRHSYLHRPGAERTLFLALYIEPQWLAEADGNFRDCAHPGFFPQACVALDVEIERLRTRIVDHMGDSSLDQPPELQQLILDLCLKISYGFSEGRSRFGIVPRDFRIGRALHYMRDRAGGPLDLNGVARFAGLSRPHFNHLFRTYTGLSPRIYLNALRIEAAVDQLHRQQDGIGAISDVLGFSAQSNFTRFFQQHTGTSPHQFRRVLSDLC